MLILGHGLFGRCDFVPGRFHVATRFFTVFFLPIVPLEGYIVLSEEGDKFNGVKIPISAKSLLLAWGRAALWGPGIALFLVGLYNLYCIMAGERVASGELSKTLGGGTLLIALGVASMFLGLKASYKRAIQLGLAAGISPQQIASEYGQPVPDDATLQQLAVDIRPTAEESGTTLGPVGRFFSFLILALIGFVLFNSSGLQLLRNGYSGWMASLWALGAGAGLALIAFGISRLFRKRNRQVMRFVYGAIGLAAVVAVIAGPWLSARWWRNEVEQSWQQYLVEVEGHLKNDRQYEYSPSTASPYALQPTAFFLVSLLSYGRSHFSINDDATQDWHGNDPHFQAVKKLAAEIDADEAIAGPRKWENRRELLQKYLPIIKSGGWPEDLK